MTPASLLSQWRVRFAEWAPELRLAVVRGTPAERDGWWRTPAHAHLVGYETVTIFEQRRSRQEPLG